MGEFILTSGFVFLGMEIRKVRCVNLMVLNTLPQTCKALSKKFPNICNTSRFSCHNYLLVIMNVRIPIQRSTEGMHNTDKAGSKQFRFIDFMKRTKNDATDRRKKAIK